MPWVHYIPISPDFRELYHLHAYFLGPALDASASSARSAWSTPAALDDGGRRQRPAVAKFAHTAQHEGMSSLKRINEAGKRWRATHARPIDAEVYVYRLALEWSRLWSRTDEVRYLYRASW